MKAVTEGLHVVNEALDSLDDQGLDELEQTRALLHLLERRTELLLTADRLVSGTVDQHAFVAPLRVTLTAENAVRRKLARLERLLAERENSTLH